MAIENAASVEEVLQKIVSRVLRKEDIALNPSSSFKEMGADSLDVVQIMVAIEEALDIELVDEEMKSISTMGGFIDYVKQKVAQKKK
jgi:acyl carrier protein